MPTATSAGIGREELEELLADPTLHLGESKRLAILRRFEERQLVLETPESIVATEPRPWTYTGVLLVRVHAPEIQTARDMLQLAAHAALESDPFVIAVEGTDVSRRPRRAS